jgi:CubicO group peptidase (beta-lactamase class C family)
LASYGPGAGPWETGKPEDFGLSQEKLEEADAIIEEKLAFDDNERFCFLLVKDGVLVHEHYYGDHTADERHTVYSVGKTVSSSLVGVAVSKGLLDLDTPIHEYGVDVSHFGKFGDQVTTRSLLGQNSGEGKYAPGSKYIYDSGQYINTISAVLDQVTPDGVGVGQWGTEHLTSKMGMQEYWQHQQQAINVGSGPPASCRELARIGQLLLNRGKWPVGSVLNSTLSGKEHRQVEQLISEDYLSQMTSPAYPVSVYI